MYVQRNNDLNQIYEKILGDILRNGKIVSPRGMETKEIHPATIVLDAPQYNITSSKYRAINPLFMMSEFFWMFAGLDEVDFVSKYNKKMRDFSDDGRILTGAYGPRLYDFNGVNQLDATLERLKKDPDTRQAVMLIYDPSKDTAKHHRDTPCNNYLKFTIRDKKLDLTVYVRSQDMVWGFCYDVFHWTILQRQMANMLGIDCGTYYHIMDSAHIYKHHYELAETISKDYARPMMLPVDFKAETFAEFKVLCMFMVECIDSETWDIDKHPVLKDSKLAKMTEELFRLHHKDLVMTTLETLDNPLLHLYKNYMESRKK